MHRRRAASGQVAQALRWGQTPERGSDDTKPKMCHQHTDGKGGGKAAAQEGGTRESQTKQGVSALAARSIPAGSTASVQTARWRQADSGQTASTSVKVGGVPQCSREVEHCGTLGTPALFQSSVEWCGTAWNGCALTTPVTPCHHLSTLGTEKY